MHTKLLHKFYYIFKKNNVCVCLLSLQQKCFSKYTDNQNKSTKKNSRKFALKFILNLSGFLENH